MSSNGTISLLDARQRARTPLWHRHRRSRPQLHRRPDDQAQGRMAVLGADTEHGATGTGPLRPLSQRPSGWPPAQSIGCAGVIPLRFAWARHLLPYPRNAAAPHHRPKLFVRMRPAHERACSRALQLRSGQHESLHFSEPPALAASASHVNHKQTGKGQAIDLPLSTCQQIVRLQAPSLVLRR